MTTAKLSTLRQIPAGIWVLGFVSLLMDVSSEMIHSLLPVFMVTALGASVLAVGLIEGVAESTALIVKVFSGALSDYLGRRKALAVLGYGLGAASKPLFALAPGIGLVVTARLAGPRRQGNARRSARRAGRRHARPRAARRGFRPAAVARHGRRVPRARCSAIGLMLLWANDFRAVFWVAVIPAVLAVLLLFGVREPEPSRPAAHASIRSAARACARLGAAYWWVVGMGAVFTLARFSEAFLVLRAQQGGLPMAWCRW